MKLIKISQDHYVIVDDSEIKEGGWFYNPRHNEIGINYNPDGCKKITHSTQPIDGDGTGACFIDIKQLPIQEVKELIGEGVDVEKKVKDYVQELIDCKSVRESERTWISAICHQMYNQALEDNKEKKYTEEDMRKMFEMGIGLSSFSDTDDNKFKYALEHIQPKTEWEVELIDGQLKLK